VVVPQAESDFVNAFTYDPNRTWAEYVAQVASAGAQAATAASTAVAEYVDTPQSDSYTAFATAVAAHTKYQTSGYRLATLASSGAHGVASREPTTAAEARRRAAYWAAIAARVSPTPAMIGARDRLASRLSSVLPPLSRGEVWPDVRVVIDELAYRDPQGAETLRTFFRGSRNAFLLERMVLAAGGTALVAGGAYYIYKRRESKRLT
jgi:hypothetical protein